MYQRMRNSFGLRCQVVVSVSFGAGPAGSLTTGNEWRLAQCHLAGKRWCWSEVVKSGSRKWIERGSGMAPIAAIHSRPPTAHDIGDVCPQNYNKRVEVAKESTRKLAVLLHADVVGPTALVRLNETLPHQRIRDTFRRFSETITTHGGSDADSHDECGPHFSETHENDLQQANRCVGEH